MAPKLKILSGKDVVRILARFGFEVRGQRGSHVKLRRVVNGENETLVLPNDASISKGTLKAIFNQASAYVPQAELRRYFYGE